MTDREKVVSHLQILRTWCAVNPDFGMGLDIDDCPKAVEWLDAALALLKEYDEALKLMVYQYCTMKPLTVHDEVFHNKFMSAGEAAFRLLGLKNGQSTDGVWERWFPNA